MRGTPGRKHLRAGFLIHPVRVVLPLLHRRPGLVRDLTTLDHAESRGDAVLGVVRPDIPGSRAQDLPNAVEVGFSVRGPRAVVAGGLDTGGLGSQRLCDAEHPDTEHSRDRAESLHRT